jgi:biopolymer transport protein ExbD
MAMDVGGSGRGAFVEINVVPLIDILLVLLVIFMIIPHRRSGLEVNLPQPAPQADPEPPPESIVVEVLADGSLRINRHPVRWEELRGRLEEIFKGRERHAAFIRGDGALEFQVVARVIDVMHAAGILSVGLMTPGLEGAAESGGLALAGRT